MKYGLFLNQKHSQCSIYESGLMIKDTLSDPNEEYILDYIETDKNLTGVDLSKPYDFCLINWHQITLPLSFQKLGLLPGKKIGIVLEVTPESCLVYTPKDGFNAFMVIDPTKTRTENFYPFPRPLEKVTNLKPLLYPDKVVLGGFGFVCPIGQALAYKRFSEVVKIANTIENCMVRFNFPVGTYTGVPYRMLMDYGDSLKRMASPGVEVRITHDYVSKADLINWCAENTLNVFPYYRNLPGLAAVTDQAIVANRPIAITESVAFRHMRQYISYYPKENYIQLIESTPPGIKQMQEDWSPENFRIKFRAMLGELGVL